MIPVRYVQYSFGQHRIFYIVEGGGDLASPPRVHCYLPNTDIRKVIELEHLDIGIYYFEIKFEIQSNHLFVFYESEQKTGILNALVRPY